MDKLIIYTGKNCHLCEIMKSDVMEIQSEYDFELEEIKIESDPELQIKYREKIPVLLINGKLFAKYRLDVANLKRKLNS